MIKGENAVAALSKAAKYVISENSLIDATPSLASGEAPKKAVDELNADGSGTHPTYGPMKDWDMSLVTDISYLFYQKGTMNADLSSWDISGVTTMRDST